MITATPKWNFCQRMAWTFAIHSRLQLLVAVFDWLNFSPNRACPAFLAHTQSGGGQRFDICEVVSSQELCLEKKKNGSGSRHLLIQPAAPPLSSSYIVRYTSRESVLNFSIKTHTIHRSMIGLDTHRKKEREYIIENILLSLTIANVMTSTMRKLKRWKYGSEANNSVCQQQFVG